MAIYFLVQGKAVHYYNLKLGFFPMVKFLISTISGHAVGIVTNDGEVYIIDAVFSVHIYSR